MSRILARRKSGERARLKDLQAAVEAAASSDAALEDSSRFDLSPEGWAWAHGILRSRGFHGPGDKFDCKVMVPLVDMLNHDDEPTCDFFYDDGDFGE